MRIQNEASSLCCKKRSKVEQIIVDIKNHMSMNRFHVGQWLKNEEFDNGIKLCEDFVQVECLHDLYYEPYDIEVLNGDNQEGDYKNTLITFRNFCDAKGKIKTAGTPHTAFLGVDTLSPLTPQEQSFIETLIANNKSKYEQWQTKRRAKKEELYIIGTVPQGTAKKTLPLVKKAIKKLPIPFTFTDLVSFIKSRNIDIICYADSDMANEEDYISFTLTYRFGEQRGKEILFSKVSQLDYTEREEEKLKLGRIFTFEMVFLSLARFVKLYDTKHPSSANAVLLENLQEVWHHLFHQDFKDCPIAKDFYTHAPRYISYTDTQAWQIISDFLKRNAKELDAEEFVVKMKSDDNLMQLYIASLKQE